MHPPIMKKSIFAKKKFFLQNEKERSSHEP